jgi:adenine-specific DNA-methyltransferase
VFVQIGDENIHLVRSLLDEVFGVENFVNLITFKKTSGAGSPSGGTDVLPAVSDYLVWYARDKSQVKYRPLYRPREVGGAGGGQYTWVEEPDGTRRRATREELATGEIAGRWFRPGPLTSQTVREAQTTVFPVEVGGRRYLPKRGGWKTNAQGMDRLGVADRLIGVGDTLQFVRYFDDFPAFPLVNLWDDTTTSGYGDPKTYVVQTNAKVVQRCLLMTTDPGDLVLDPTNGSGTTAVVAEEWGRRWVTVDTSRVAVALTRTRLAALRLPYYLLADSAAGARKDEELTGRLSTQNTFGQDVRKGFVYKRVPHIMLRDIAQNPDIKPGMSQVEIDEAIARHSDQELLFDQPYEDPKIVRVCGPFTVESLSPHRVLAADHVPESEGLPASTESFEQTVLSNLLKAGVQNQVREQRLKFESLEPFAAEWITARGTFIDTDGETRQAAVSLGPEYGTVGADQVREAAREAVKGVGFDLLLVCGFAFDAASPETAHEFRPEVNGGWAVTAEERKFGKLPVLLVRMNPDLSMGEDLLKQTGAGNLFTVFGEPDVQIDRHERRQGRDRGPRRRRLRPYDRRDPLRRHRRDRLLVR